MNVAMCARLLPLCRIAPVHAARADLHRSVRKLAFNGGNPGAVLSAALSQFANPGQVSGGDLELPFGSRKADEVAEALLGVLLVAADDGKLQQRVPVPITGLDLHF